MSVKLKLKNIKDEFQEDGKMLEGVFRMEILYKRYRRVIIFILCLAVCVCVSYVMRLYFEDKRVNDATRAYAQLIENSSDEEALKKLAKASPELYDLYRYANARGDDSQLETLTSSTNAFVRSLAIYDLASNKAGAALNDGDKLKDKLDSYIVGLDQVSGVSLKNLALLQEAYLYFLAGSPKEAHQKLMLIPSQVDSAIQPSVMMLKHYQPNMKE